MFFLVVAAHMFSDGQDIWTVVGRMEQWALWRHGGANPETAIV